MEPPFKDTEQRFLLAEAIKHSDIPLDRLVRVLTDGNVTPDWEQMQIPHSRNVNSCRRTWDILRNEVRTGLTSSSYYQQQHPSAPSSSHKRRSTLNQYDSSGEISSPKRRQSGTDITTTRTIQPKPTTTALASPQQYSPSTLGPGEPGKKKRGRPSKAEIEKRNRVATERGEILPLDDPITSTGPEGMAVTMGVSGAHRDRDILPSPKIFPPIMSMPDNPNQRHPIAAMISATPLHTPSSEQRSPFRIQAEGEANQGADARNKRGRLASKPAKPGESSFQLTTNPSQNPPYYDPVRMHTTPAYPATTSAHSMTASSPRRNESENPPPSFPPTYTPHTEYPSYSQQSDPHERC
ncbi:hypothetical protein BJ878DRAFT_188460 [Calycina marina]|uniref:Uncharacterized protein n=1 Tax=Calycina marina TaxID=1763456 RepID=A0A9P8CEA5_9HELO|nr:hypothetical protein BJ878DRAFT_188460 [Calycina marina]